MSTTDAVLKEYHVRCDCAVKFFESCCDAEYQQMAAMATEIASLRARLDACDWVVEVASKLGEQYGRQHLSAAIYAYRSQRDAKTEADQ